MELKSLSHYLMHSWNNFEKQILLFEKKRSRTNVHALRVATRRAEAILTLSKPLVGNRHIVKVLKTLKSTRQCLGVLRNLQVEEVLMRNPVFKCHEMKNIQKKIISDRAKEAKRCLEVIFKIKYKKLTSYINEIEVELLKIEDQIDGRELNTLLSKQADLCLLTLKKKVNGSDPTKIDELHKMRKGLKIYRYEIEVLGELNKKVKNNSTQLKFIQRNTGDYLDLKRLESKIIAGSPNSEKGKNAEIYRILSSINKMSKNKEINFKTVLD